LHIFGASALLARSNDGHWQKKHGKLILERALLSL
jgi:hypothetical protein